MAVRGVKRVSAESYKEVLLSVGSEKGGRKESMGVSADRRTLLPLGKIDGRYGID